MQESTFDDIFFLLGGAIGAACFFVPLQVARVLNYGRRLRAAPPEWSILTMRIAGGIMMLGTIIDLAFQLEN